MLTVTINSDITEYRPKVAFGLTLRTIGCIAAALGCSIAIGALLVGAFGVAPAAVVPLFWVPAAPCALVGFVTPHGMPFERFAPLWLRHRYGRHRLSYASPDANPRLERLDERRRHRADREERIYRKLAGSKGVELWSPGGELRFG